MIRTIFIWLFGLIAAGIVGGMIGSWARPYGDAPFFGFIAGLCTFACARLWLVPSNR